jgi:ribosomal protein L24E
MTVYREVSEMPRCGSCGKLLTVGGVEVDRSEQRLVFCSQQCIRVFDTYKAPKYGADAIWPESVVG